MQLGQPHPVGVVHNQRVGVGNVHPRLNDGRADQNVNLPGQHPLPYLLQCLLVHLPVGDRDARIRQCLLETRRRFADILHRVVQVKHLPAAPQLSPHGFL